MIIKTHEIKEEGFDLHVDIADKEGSWLKAILKESLQEAFFAKARGFVHLRLEMFSDNISMTGELSAESKPTCDRCIEPFDREISIPIHMNMAPETTAIGRKRKKGEVQRADDDENFIFYEGEEVNLADILREMIELEKPIRFLCSEACRGLCPSCGINLNEKQCACHAKEKPSPFDVLKDIVK
jgi:uncharacterized protein